MKQPGNRGEKGGLARVTFFTRDEHHRHFVRAKTPELRRQAEQKLDCRFGRQAESFRRSLECRRRRGDEEIAADRRRREELADPTKAANLRDVID